VTGAIPASPTGSPIRVLFVCTGNSARSVMAEALLRRRGGTDFEVYSAGTEPRGINPLTVRVLSDAGLSTTGLRSKSVNEFLEQHFDYVITVCDQARQVCPVFPGSHQSLHWGYEDPALAIGSEEERLAVFRRVFTQIGERVRLFVPLALRTRVEGTGAGMNPGTDPAGVGRGR
jgi:arsenate reductase